MERFLVFLAAVAMLNSAAPDQDDISTLEGFILHARGVNIEYQSEMKQSEYWEQLHYFLRMNDEILSLSVHEHLTGNILRHLIRVHSEIMSEFASDLAKVPVQSVYRDLNYHCAEYLETPIEDLALMLSNVSCVTTQLRTWLLSKVDKLFKVSLQKLSRKCPKELQPLCSSNCTMAYEKRFGFQLHEYIEDASGVDLEGYWTPVDIILEVVDNGLDFLLSPYRVFYTYVSIMSKYTDLVPTIKPFTFLNLIRDRKYSDFQTSFFLEDRFVQSRDWFTWGIVRSYTGRVGHPCFSFRSIYSRGSREYTEYLAQCSFANVFQTTFDLIRCASTNETSKPMTWETVPSAYCHSQCLCLAYKGAECGVTPPPGVDPHLYCFSVLLRDFQRQVSHRPAVTYLDYAFMTRVPLCQFAKLLVAGFKRECKNYGPNIEFRSTLSVQCYFHGLVNYNLNCSETLQVDTYNATFLCVLQDFMNMVICEGDAQASVRYYEPGDSPLVQVLTYVDVSVRVLTLTTYLACAQLRNLPGKLLIGYQVTAMLRLVAVRGASLEDLALVVRLDVIFDLASTLWLTAYLQFLTSSIRTLRLPDSLTTAEALAVLLRCALFGWALPAALSTTFFWLDEALDSRLMVGQLLFVLCNYVALLANLFMFFYNSHFYYDVKKGSLGLKVGATTRSVFGDLFNFALKTSVLSGVGIIFRLVFTQIQGLEHLLGYYHALGTLQALLVFLLYGCNREARCFWRRVLCRTLFLCRRRQNTVV